MLKTRMKVCCVFLVILAIALSVSQVTAQPDSTMAVRQKVCLNGLWDFKAAGTSDSEIPTEAWKKLPVPSSWVGWARDDFKLSLSEADAKLPHAWFRRSFFVPQAWADGRRIKLNFQAVDDAHKIYVNGKLAGEHKSLKVCFEVDITSLVRFGQDNSLAVWVQNGKRRGVSESGILRSVYLVTVPPVHIEYSHVLSSVQKMTLTVRTRLRNEDTVKRSVTVRAVVKDNGKVVLSLPQKTLDIAPGESVEAQISAPWSDPVLWGFGKYGQPYLYHLQTKLDGEGAGDVRYDRFGFREFRSRGPKFLLNEKPIFLKGDHFCRGWTFVENPEYVPAFYQGSRAANINFMRLCNTPKDNFDSAYWFQVADELGHLVEALKQRFGYTPRDRTPMAPDNPEFMALWTAYVNQHFNHPSLVMWSPDNEHTPRLNVIDKFKTLIPPWNTLTSYLRKLDPTRIVNYHHGFGLYAGVALGVFDKENFMTFNIHPYGNVGAAIEKAKRSVNFDGSVPIVAGEIWEFPKAFDMLAEPDVYFAEQRRRAKVFYDNILAVAKHGAAGANLCTLHRSGYLGYSSDRKLRLGPWEDHVLVRDESKPDKPIVGERQFLVKVRWPSLSGEGTKAQTIQAYYSTTRHGGRGPNFNWFDSTKPMFIPSLVHSRVRGAFRKVDGRDEPVLGPKRAPEVVVCFGLEGKPVEGAYVYLVPEDGQAPPPSAVATDKDGTAWFHFWDTGRYRAVAWHEGKAYSKSFVLSTRPDLSDKPGYDHIAWVDLGGIDIESRRQELAKPAEFTKATVRKIKIKLLAKRKPAPAKLTPHKPGPFAVDQQGFIRDWLACGPFPNLDYANNKDKKDHLAAAGGENKIEPTHGTAYEVAFPPSDYWSEGKLNVAWGDLHSNGAMVSLTHLKADFLGIGQSPLTDYISSYAACYIDSPEARDVVLAIGSDDGHKVWLNQQLIGQNPEQRGAAVDQDKYPVHLRKGRNVLVIKVTQIIGGYAFYLRFLDGEEPLTDLTVRLNP